MVSRYTQLNGTLGEFRARAWEAGWHLWLLGQDTEIVDPVGFRPEGVPIVSPRKPPLGYFISCWVCGLSYATSRWKAVRQSTCGHAALACGKHMSQIARVTINDRVLPSFQEWLRRINATPERRALHWPQIVQDGLKLATTKSMPFSKLCVARLSFIRSCVRKWSRLAIKSSMIGGAQNEPSDSECGYSCR